jgi:putative phosphoesterase
LRVAALYDVHGNLPALEAVLAEAAAADLIVVGGDFVGGEQPAETIERLRSLDDRVKFIRGNAERELLEPSPPRPGGPPPGAIEEIRSKLTDEQLAFAFGVPQQDTFEIDGLGRVLFCHATPRSDEEIVTPLTSESRLREVLDGVEADVVVAGHTHIQDDRRAGPVRFLNPGSVGMPYEERPGAYWALLGPDVELRRTDYPAAEAPLATRTEAAEYFESLVG